MIQFTQELSCTSEGIVGGVVEDTMTCTYSEDNKVTLTIGLTKTTITATDLVAIQNMMSYCKGEFDDNETTES